MKITNNALEWAGCTAGLIGAFLLALNLPFSGLGFCFFLISNVFWLLFSLRISSKGLFLMQLGFMATSILGLVRWL